MDNNIVQVVSLVRALGRNIELARRGVMLSTHAINVDIAVRERSA